MLVLKLVCLLCNLCRSLLKISAAAKNVHNKFKYSLGFRLSHQTRLLHFYRTLLVDWERIGKLLYFTLTTGTETEFYEI